MPTRSSLGGASSLTKVAAIGSQIFYKVSGAIGNALAFRQPYSGVEPGIATGVRNATATAGAALPTAVPALTRYALGGGASVAVYRGSAPVTAAALVTSPIAGVRVHFGTATIAPDVTPEDAPEASASSVTVHRGPSPEAAALSHAASPTTPPATVTASATDAGSASPPPAG